jgi:hypothetical protein
MTLSQVGGLVPLVEVCVRTGVEKMEMVPPPPPVVGGLGWLRLVVDGIIVPLPCDTLLCAVIHAEEVNRETSAEAASSVLLRDMT